jgi:preprotein translocase subunit YajC
MKPIARPQTERHPQNVYLLTRMQKGDKVVKAMLFTIVVLEVRDFHQRSKAIGGVI